VQYVISLLPKLFVCFLSDQVVRTSLNVLIWSGFIETVKTLNLWVITINHSKLYSNTLKENEIGVTIKIIIL